MKAQVEHLVLANLSGGYGGGLCGRHFAAGECSKVGRFKVRIEKGNGLASKFTVEWIHLANEETSSLLILPAEAVRLSPLVELLKI